MTQKYSVWLAADILRGSYSTCNNILLDNMTLLFIAQSIPDTLVPIKVDVQTEL